MSDCVTDKRKEIENEKKALLHLHCRSKHVESSTKGLYSLVRVTSSCALEPTEKIYTVRMWLCVPPPIFLLYSVISVSVWKVLFGLKLAPLLSSTPFHHGMDLHQPVAAFTRK